ncbi:MAG: SMI1/KNR4 family protein [Mucilaginibacter sp.]|uniref:SMI1/KNR4 family protein n=1 Tax=Mucilaginibacter sp. TaxID=1882438 RepID=UPI0031B0DF98
MENWIEEVITKWQLEGVRLNPPAAISDIEEVESILDFRFPEDFKAFYSVINGFDGLDWQEHMFTFWPLKLIIEDFEAASDKSFIGFCDFLINSYSIGFVRNRDGIFKSYNYIENKESIARSFEEVVDMINSNNDLIY